MSWFRWRRGPQQEKKHVWAETEERILSLFHTLSFSFVWRMSTTGSSAYHCVAHLPNNKTMFMLSTPPTTTFFATPRVLPFLSSKLSSSSSSSTASSSPCCSSITPKVKSKDNNNCYLVSAKHSPANMSASVSSRTFLNARNEQGSLLSLSSLFFFFCYLRTSLLSYLCREPLQFLRFFLFLREFAHWGLARFVFLFLFLLCLFIRRMEMNQESVSLDAFLRRLRGFFHLYYFCLFIIVFGFLSRDWSFCFGWCWLLEINTVKLVA